MQCLVKCSSVLVMLLSGMTYAQEPPGSAKSGTMVSPEEATSLRLASNPTKPLTRALRKTYLGTHTFKVNEVDGARGKAKITEAKDGALTITASVKASPVNYCDLEGTVEVVDQKKFIVHGKISGRPSFQNDGKFTEMTGAFGFEVRKGRKFWRMYTVNGEECPCNGPCHVNNFCYVEVHFKKMPGKKARKKKSRR
jgi:hypothetical protein